VYQRHRVLRSLLQLKEFTVADVAWASGVTAGTVRTVLHREPWLVKPCGRVRTGRRGGAPMRYQLLPEGAKRIQQDLAELEGLGSVPSLSYEELDRGEVPAPLIASEDILLTRVPRASRDERVELLGVARTLIADGEETLETAQPESYDQDSELHLAVSKVLLQLGHAELADELTLASAAELHVNLAQVTAQLAGIEDERLRTDFERRWDLSPVASELKDASDRVMDVLRPIDRIVLVDAIDEEEDPITARVQSWADDRDIEVLVVSSDEVPARIEDLEREGTSVLVTMDASEADSYEQLVRVGDAFGQHGFAVIGMGSTPALTREVYGSPFRSYVDVKGLSGAAFGRAISGAIAQLVGYAFVRQ
jgi:hypothetical protein